MKPTNENILLCMDMDRTVLPNGRQDESPRAREILRRIADRTELIIAYVSGRRKELQMDAIREYDLPVPAYSVADVGTSIYEITDGKWTLVNSWHDQIAKSWRGRTGRDLMALLEDIKSLRLQDDDSQTPYKLSYFAGSDLDHGEVEKRVRERLQAVGIRASIIWSLDETTDTGLLDVLPEGADKRHAVEFLMSQTGVTPDRMVYAGDSGNDLPVLTSGLQAVLVGNAIDEVRKRAREGVRGKGCPERLYVAGGGFLGLNGNYAGGVLEGLAHFIPETRAWMQ